MSSEEDLLKRVIQVRNLKENCFKYLEEVSKELLTHKIIFAIAEITYEKRGPVKLAEIAQKIIGESDKKKQDLVRLTIDKSLLKCGLVEKLRYSANDVRYALTAYRFQKVKGIDSFRGESEELIGKVYELPKSTWPIPDEFFILVAKKFGYGEALKKNDRLHRVAGALATLAYADSKRAKFARSQLIAAMKIVQNERAMRLLCGRRAL